MKRIALKVSIITAVLIILDQATKYYALSNFQTPIEVIPDFFRLTYSENTGIAFSIPVPQTALIITNILLLSLLTYIAKNELKLEKRLPQVLLAMILAGGIGNLLDRFFLGYVIDFISIWKWPIFNFADTYVTVGILVLLAFYGKIKRI